MRLFVIVLALSGVAFGLAWSLGCCSSPDATSLPADEGAIQVVGGDATTEIATPPTPAEPVEPVEPVEPAQPAAPVDASGLPPPRVVTSNGPRTPAPAEPAKSAKPAPVTAPPPSAVTPVPSDMKYSALLLKSVKGGRIVYAARGTVEEVVEMLGDFENAAGNRAWAQTYETLERGKDRVLAKWKFRGKFGMNPTVHLEFLTTRQDEGATVKFSLKKKSLGIASFFGDFQVTPLPGTPARSQIVERTFIDSGIAFANASAEDIEKGLREDARLIRLWMDARSAK